MDTNVREERLQTHALIDMLPPEKLSAVRSLLEVMVPETRTSLADRLSQAAIEDEEITPEMAARLDRARASAERGETVRHEEILREFGLD